MSVEFISLSIFSDSLPLQLNLLFQFFFSGGTSSIFFIKYFFFIIFSLLDLIFMPRNISSISSILITFIFSSMFDLQSGLAFSAIFSFYQVSFSVSLTSFIVLIWFLCLTCSMVFLICSSIMFSIINLTSSGICLSEFIGSLVPLISSIFAEVN